MICTLFVLSLLGGFCSGLLGVGGAVLLIPLLLTTPPLVGVGSLSMHEISGITMVQVFAASVTGCLAHRRSGFAHMRTILTIGIPMGVFSFVGAAASKSMTSQSLLLIFGCLVALAFVMLLKRSSGESDETVDFGFNGLLSAASGICVGFVSGIVGAGGGFILIPVMIRILKMPIRVAVGSSLGIVFIGALMGSMGKILTLQVEWLYLLPVIAGSLPSSLLGAQVSKKIAPSRIRHILLFLVLIVLMKTWYDVAKIYDIGNRGAHNKPMQATPKGAPDG
ncbi:MAG: sulfite exporter TauE/SafE family protein [Candidatus Celaenobacter polaris]|nr:sulfite exporter TauE/SafE family protein [Candidatus Celaenobacter polaris]